MTILVYKARISRAYEYRIKNDIKKKIKSFAELEMPSLFEKGFLDNSVLSKYNQNPRISPQVNNQNVSINTSNFEIQSQNMVGRKGLT